jgi:hypothetical protein
VLEFKFKHTILKPILGEYLGEDKLVEIPDGFLDDLAKKLDRQFDISVSCATVMPNLTMPPWSVSVEIKPKCGFLPDHPMVHHFKVGAVLDVQKRHPRFRLHQALKKPDPEKRSGYDPLDMFSNDKVALHF